MKHTMKHKIIITLVAVIVAVSGSVIATNKAEAATVQVDKGKVIAYVKMRTGASTARDVIRTLSPGETFRILDKVGAGYWFKIKDEKGKVGYVSTSSKYVKRMTPTPTPLPVTTPPSKPSVEAWEQKADVIIAYGKKYVGTPYVYGGGRNNDLSFDCSGFVSWVLNQNGVNITKSGSVTQAKAGTFVPRSELRKGDLIFSDTNKDGVINHVSLYIGNDQVLHTYKVGIGVVVSKFSGSAWDRGYVTTKRFF